MGISGKSCNKMPILTVDEAKRTAEVLGKIEPGGYFNVSKVLDSKTFKKHFACGRMEGRSLLRATRVSPVFPEATFSAIVLPVATQ